MKQMNNRRNNIITTDSYQVLLSPAKPKRKISNQMTNEKPSIVLKKRSRKKKACGSVYNIATFGKDADEHLYDPRARFYSSLTKRLSLLPTIKEKTNLLDLVIKAQDIDKTLDFKMKINKSLGIIKRFIGTLRKSVRNRKESERISNEIKQSV